MAKFDNIWQYWAFFNDIVQCWLVLFNIQTFLAISQVIQNEGKYLIFLRTSFDNTLEDLKITENIEQRITNCGCYLALLDNI